MSHTFLQSASIAPSSPPASEVSVLAWFRRNLFSSVGNTILTLAAFGLVYVTVPALYSFLIGDAVFAASIDKAGSLTDESCRAYLDANGVLGACWPYVQAKWSFFVYGSYPLEERWRVNIVFALFAFSVIWVLWLDAPKRAWAVLCFLVLMPIVSYVLLTGLTPFGAVLKPVNTAFWGGILVTLIVSTVGIVASLPIGILLALGRQSKLPVIRFSAIVFIEVVRGVPLVTMLFMANVMLPLFLPRGTSIDVLLRALIGVGLFSAAYMAEVIRGGLQAIKRGQYEGAMSLGLSYWQMMRLIILPQALKIVIPGIVNIFIALFKDTTLVYIVGLMDFLRAIEASRSDLNWAVPSIGMTGYAAAGLFYFFCCWGMSWYSTSIERRLRAGERR
jgi:general L-amino acid transport system permease protein